MAKYLVSSLSSFFLLCSPVLCTTSDSVPAGVEENKQEEDILEDRSVEAVDIRQQYYIISIVITSF